MDERQDQDQDRNPSESDPAANGIPSVEAPKLAADDAVEDSGAHGRQGSPRRSSMDALPTLFSGSAEQAPREPAAADARPRAFRFALLAASIALAAGIGALVGSLSASGIGHHAVAEGPSAKSADARDVLQTLRAQSAELSSLKTELDSANRSAGAQFAKLADRLNSIERAQADPAAKLAHIADAVDRLDKRSETSPDVTGSIAARPSSASSEANLPVVRNWEVADVHGGRALVASRYGSEFLVGSGSVLPGLGRVQEVKRQNGQWVVITERGIITSGR